jgi:glycosyltransferase involved in cell wall biosynthesis
LVPPGQTPAPNDAAIRPERCKGDTAQGLNVIGYLRSENGIGEIARGTLRALTRVGYPVAKTSIEINDLARKEEDSCRDVPDGTPYPVNLFHVNSDQVPTVVDALGHELMTGRRNIGYWFWETSSFPAQWLDRFQYFAEIWVASSFLQATLAPLSPVPVVRMRPCVEVKPALGVGRSEFDLPEDKFLFLFVFDPFSVPERKNPLGLVEAYRRAFGSRPDKTLLVMKVNQLDRIPGFEANLGIDEGWATRFVESVTSVSGKVVDRYLRRNELHALFNACDAFVSLHRSEGFGLTMAEAMLLGKPCIGTAYSANMEFMTPANSYLVDYRMQELDRDFGPYTRGTVWAEPDLDHAAALMRYVFEHREEARLRGATAQEDIGRLHGERAVGQQIAARLELIGRGMDRVSSSVKAAGAKPDHG